MTKTNGMAKTYGEMMDLIVGCTTKEQAQELVRSQIAIVLQDDPLILEEQARARVLHNIGYLTGYLDRSEAARLLDLFETRHPMFGAIADWPKTPEETIEMGFKVGMRAKRGEGR